MDACMHCPYYDECSKDPGYLCFLDTPEETEYWKRIGRSDA